MKTSALGTNEIPFKIQGTGEQTRAFVYIEDLIEGLLLVLNKGEHLNIYNIGTSEEVTIRERMLAIMVALESRSSMEFEVFLSEEFSGSTVSKAVIVASFIGMLELTRLAAIRIYQSIDEVGVPAGPIHLRMAVKAGDRSWAKDLPELM